MALHNKQVEMLAALKQDPAFIFLCELLQHAIDSIGEKLADPNTDKFKTDELIPYWRALIQTRKFFTEQTDTADNLMKISQINPDLAEVSPKITNELAEHYRRIQQLQEMESTE